MITEYVLLFLSFCTICTILIIKLYGKIRPRYPIKVNCWFCDKNTVVPYGNKNCWDCPFCEQYNGFSEDGDYNKPIPAQHIEDLNHPINDDNDQCADRSKFVNELCDRCNQNQRLKIRQLAKFKPHFEATFDEEIAQFSKQLDKKYELCQACEINLHSKLIGEKASLQNSILDHQLNDSTDQETVLSRSIYRSQLQSTSSLTLRMLAIIISFLLFCCDLQNLQEDSRKIVVPFKTLIPKPMQFLVAFSPQASMILPIAGLFAVILAVFRSGKYRLQKVDGLNSITWVCVLFLHSQPFTNILPIQDVLLIRPLSSLVIFVLTLICVACRRYTFMKSYSAPINYNTHRPSPAKSFRSLNNSFDDCCSEDAFTSISQQTCHRCSSSVFDTPKVNGSQVNSTNSTSKLPRVLNIDNMNRPQGNTTQSMFVDQFDSFERESFSPKAYSEFSRPHSRLNSRPVLQPSKLRFMNQLNASKPWSRSSWIDGGFWDNNFNNVNGIHHSNQSSFSGFAGEDQFSAFSEPVIPSKQRRLNSRNEFMDMSSFISSLPQSSTKKMDEKTSEYGSDSQFSISSQRIYSK